MRGKIYYNSRNKTGNLFSEQRNVLGKQEYDNLKPYTYYFSEVKMCHSRQTQVYTTAAPIIREVNSFNASRMTANSTISGGANVNLKAASIEYITLDEGFDVALGRDFAAELIPTVCPAEYNYEYVLRDHLGNTRVLLSDINNNGTIE